METYLGIDVGSVTTKLALMAEGGALVFCSYMRTQGMPIAVLQNGLKDIEKQIPPHSEIRGVGVTGSARYLAGAIVGADLVKNEITAQAVASLHYVPGVRTIMEIGGQDSKLICIRDGMVVDFAMNTVCAAGTGSFLEQQASRLGVKIEDFGRLALGSVTPVHISGPCTVFAESDMIHKQQMGHETRDIIYGLCQSLVRNYLNDVGRGKDIVPPILFQGGVAFNKGIIRAFEESLGTEIVVPLHHEMMGAIGMALLAHEKRSENGKMIAFKIFEVGDVSYRTSSFECTVCSKLCEVAQLLQNDQVVACWGGRCDLWEVTKSGQTSI
jgi:predicted CoA-substrate-specific enzyme activase